jgi:hypothetical protein
MVFWSAVSIGVLLLVLAFFTSVFWYPGITPMQTARILAQDSDFGMRGLRLGRLWGDRILTPLREASNDFSDLNGRNAFWISELLAQNASLSSNRLSLELYQRPSSLAHLVGSIGLAAHGALPRNEFLEGGSLNELLKNEHLVLSVERMSIDTTSIELSLVAAKYARATESVPSIIRILQQRPASYWVHAYACDALGAIGDQRAVPVLEEAMRTEDFHALPNAFAALFNLSGDRAIPLAIDRISPEIRGRNAGYIVQELEKVTGKNYGYDQEQWRQWWAGRSSAIGSR